MRQREFDYDDILRRALRTAADGIEPSADGLERIRARLTMPRPLAVAWLMVGYTEVALPALARAWSALSSLRVRLRPGSGQAAQARAAYRHLAPALVRRYGWLRPAAVASAIVIAVAGGFALSQLPGAISNSGAENLPLSNVGTHPHGGSANSGAASQFPGPSKTSGAVERNPASVAVSVGNLYAEPEATWLRLPAGVEADAEPDADTHAVGHANAHRHRVTDADRHGHSVADADLDGRHGDPYRQSGAEPGRDRAAAAKPVDPATSPSPGKKSTPISALPCRSGR